MMALDEKYRDELLLALRMHEISGEHVGEVLAEVEAHVRETGEDPAEAFGKPREYAAQVAEQLDGAGKSSTLGIAISVLATAALTMFGSDFLLDALFERTDSIAYTLKDTVALLSLLVLFVAGTLLVFKAYTAKAANKAYGFAAIAAFGLGILAQYLAGQFFDDVTPLYELPRWGAGVLGALALAGAIAFMVRAARRGRVVYPKVS
ncbi:hypothetical protein [Saccharopolyspora sp. NPDC002686]|uniref:hypothetical protein n=1 Tax=Saccharopolyspora sp. NPDC002686 TaxID=3154541 RepID=UPI0033342203